jgi:hypothetical protein
MYSETDDARPGPSFASKFLSLVQRPQQILWLWNWKSALLSILLRGPIFLVATARHGWKASLGAFLVESLFCALTAGFYGAMVQFLRNAEPPWLTITFLTIVMPAGFQGLEYWLHWLRGTPHLRVAEIVSVVISACSTLFNWYAMRRGTLLVGGEGASFASDLRRLPLLFFRFITTFSREAKDKTL